MIDEFKRHYYSRQKEIQTRLKEFEKFRKSSDKKLFEEVVFCVFAANSSATMAQTALKLLKPILFTGTLEDYQKTIEKKVRFYNIRSKYLYENRLVMERYDNFLNHLESLEHHERRLFIKTNFKGFGMKESSHFLRNIGFKNYCIIDKHVLNLMTEFSVLDSANPPKNVDDYLTIEKKIINFAEENNYNIDELDLALWSFKTGKVMR